MSITAPTHRHVPEVAQITPPDGLSGFSTLPVIDYADAFTLVDGDARTAEEWAGLVLLGAPFSTRAQLVAGWTALGLRLGPPWSPDRVLGWEVRRRDPEVLLLGADSWLGLHGELLFRAEPDGLLFATLIHHRGPLARATWARITDRHQRVVASLLRQAARRL